MQRGTHKVLPDLHHPQPVRLPLTSIHFCASWKAESALDSLAGWCWWDAPMPAAGLAIGEEEAPLSNCSSRFPPKSACARIYSKAEPAVWVSRTRRTSHQGRLVGCRSSRSSTGEARKRTTSCSPVVPPVWEAEEETAATGWVAAVIARGSGLSLENKSIVVGVRHVHVRECFWL